MANEYKGEVGTIYFQRAKDVEGKEYEVWFEDFNIIGLGKTKMEALKDAAEFAVDLGKLVESAMAQEAASGG